MTPLNLPELQALPRSYSGSCHVTVLVPADQFNALIAAAEERDRLREALKAMVIMSDRGPQPSKFDEALSWRDNDLRARELARLALAEQEPTK